jgi:thioredoxin 1
MPIPSVSPVEAAALVERGRPLVLAFKSPWCPQCGPQHRVIERVRDEMTEGVGFASIDIGDHPAAVDVFCVASLPTLLLFKDGVLARRLSGFTGASQLKAGIEGLLSAEACNEPLAEEDHAQVPGTRC